MENLWLQLHYKDKAFDYQVRDTDKMQLLDLILGLEVESMKQSVMIPETYDLHYLSMRVKRKIPIGSDSDLVTMFTDMEGEGTIDVYLTDTKNPMKHFALAAELKRKQKKEEERKQREVEEILRRETEADALRNVQPIAIEIPIVNPDSQETEYVSITFQESQFVADDAPPQSQQTQQSPLHSHQCINHHYIDHLQKIHDPHIKNLALVTDLLNNLLLKQDPHRKHHPNKHHRHKLNPKERYQKQQLRGRKLMFLRGSICTQWSTTTQCSICKNYGHNARGCKGGETAKNIKGAAGGGKTKKRGDGVETSKQGAKRARKNDAPSSGKN